MKKEKKFVVLETLRVPISISKPKSGTVRKTRIMRLDGRGRWATADEAKRQAEYVKKLCSKRPYRVDYSYEVAKIVTFKEVAI